MGKPKTVFEEPPPPPFSPPPVPDMGPEEIDAALRSGGVTGIMRAILAKSPELDARQQNMVLGHVHSTSAKLAEALIQTYRQGHGGPDHSDMLDQASRLAFGAEVLSRTILYVARWMADNPGTIVNDHLHSSGKRRVF